MGYTDVQGDAIPDVQRSTRGGNRVLHRYVPGLQSQKRCTTGTDGPITSAELVIGGQSFMGYNGGPYFSFSQGFSLFVNCDDQVEVDEYWNKLVNAGATPSMTMVKLDVAALESAYNQA